MIPICLKICSISRLTGGDFYKIHLSKTAIAQEKLLKRNVLQYGPYRWFLTLLIMKFTKAVSFIILHFPVPIWTEKERSIHLQMILFIAFEICGWTTGGTPIDGWDHLGPCLSLCSSDLKIWLSLQYWTGISLLNLSGGLLLLNLVTFIFRFDSIFMSRQM